LELVKENEMNIQWKLKIDDVRYEEELMNVESVEDLYNKTKYGYFDLMIYEGGFDTDYGSEYEKHYDDDGNFDEEGYEDEVFGMDVKDFLEQLKYCDGDFDYRIEQHVVIHPF
jgi:hypothetical protein|tara:strand:+ start:793 stop:1131 length:339 start_codon:yes stop_codon:yes gene_type:complete